MFQTDRENECRLGGRMELRATMFPAVTPKKRCPPYLQLLIIGQFAASTGELLNAGTKFLIVCFIFLIRLKNKSGFIFLQLMFCCINHRNTWDKAFFKPWVRRQPWVLQDGLGLCFGWCRKGKEEGGALMPGMLAHPKQYPYNGKNFSYLESGYTTAHF